MNISIKNEGPCRRRIRVEISLEEVSARFERFWGEFGKKARVPGFRVGKAPRAVLEKQFQERARQDVVEDLIATSYWGVVRDKKMRPVQHPSISDVKFADGKPLVYEAQVEVWPEFRLSDYKGLPLKRRPAEVSDEEVNQALEGLRKRNAQYVDAGARPLTLADFAVIDYRCTVEGQEPEERKNFGVEVGGERILPVLRTGLVGMSSGETKKIETTFPADHERKSWAGKKGVFEVTVKEAKEPRLPALDDELAKDAGCDSLETLRAKIREGIQRRKDEIQKESDRAQVIDVLLSKHLFEVPESVRGHQEEHLWEATENRLMMSGWPKERIEEEKPKLKEKIREESVRQVRLAYLIEAIAQKEGIAAKEEEITSWLGEIAREARTSVEALKKRGQNGRLEEDIRDRIVREKVFQLLVEQAAVEV
ncbi:MAG: trigger factor [Candidatus Omnitrophica bacterium]|nr:trigger factor [Candidatus Omnitrophota bacterium]